MTVTQKDAEFIVDGMLINARNLRERAINEMREHANADSPFAVRVARAAAEVAQAEGRVAVLSSFVATVKVKPVAEALAEVIAAFTNPSSQSVNQIENHMTSEGIVGVRNGINDLTAVLRRLSQVNDE